MMSVLSRSEHSAAYPKIKAFVSKVRARPAWIKAEERVRYKIDLAGWKLT